MLLAAAEMVVYGQRSVERWSDIYLEAERQMIELVCPNNLF